jgi:hypothetical protein
MIPHSSPAKLSGLTAGSPQSAHSEIRMKNITLSEIESTDKLARLHFVMELLNFMHRPANPPVVKP